MSGDMVERVARALDPIAWGYDSSWLAEGPSGVARRDRLRVVAKDRARAAIAAMREPTETMSAAGFEAWRKTVICSDTSQGADIWRKMIDAALAEPEGK